MDEHSASTMQSTSFLPFAAAHSNSGVERDTDFSPTRPSAKHTLFACTLLLSYVAGYVAVGYTVILAIEHVWTAIFR